MIFYITGYILLRWYYYYEWLINWICYNENNWILALTHLTIFLDQNKEHSRFYRIKTIASSCLDLCKTCLFFIFLWIYKNTLSEDWQSQCIANFVSVIECETSFYSAIQSTRLFILIWWFFVWFCAWWWWMLSHKNDKVKCEDDFSNFSLCLVVWKTYIFSISQPSVNLYLFQGVNLG